MEGLRVAPPVGPSLALARALADSDSRQVGAAEASSEGRPVSRGGHDVQGSCPLQPFPEPLPPALAPLPPSLLKRLPALAPLPPSPAPLPPSLTLLPPSLAPLPT